MNKIELNDEEKNLSLEALCKVTEHCLNFPNLPSPMKETLQKLRSATRLGLWIMEKFLKIADKCAFLQKTLLEAGVQISKLKEEKDKLQKELIVVAGERNQYMAEIENWRFTAATPFDQALNDLSELQMQEEQSHLGGTEDDPLEHQAIADTLGLDAWQIPLLRVAETLRGDDFFHDTTNKLKKLAHDAALAYSYARQEDESLAATDVADATNGAICTTRQADPRCKIPRPSDN